MATKVETEYDETESPTSPRELGVLIVDMCCGYTVEHATSRRQHEYLYDRVTSFIQGIINKRVEEAIWAAADSHS